LAVDENGMPRPEIGSAVPADSESAAHVNELYSVLLDLIDRAPDAAGPQGPSMPTLAAAPGATLTDAVPGDANRGNGRMAGPDDGRAPTAGELEQYGIQHQLIRQWGFPQTFDPANPNQRLFVATFDGTWNDRDRMPIASNPAELERLYAQISRGSPNIKSEYLAGVGTGGGIDPAIGGAFGAGAAERAERMYELLVTQADQWKRGDANAEIVVNILGFSRGSAIGRHFANLLYERGIPDLATERRTQIWDESSASFRAEVSYDGHHVPPGQVPVGAMLLYDTVATGQGTALKLSIPPNVQAVLHLTATDEPRNVSFALESVIDPARPGDPRLLELPGAGAHADRGGGYDRGIGAVNLFLGHEFLKLTGSPLPDRAPGVMTDDAALWIHNPLAGIPPYEIVETAARLLGVTTRQVVHHSNPEVPAETLRALYPKWFEVQDPPAPVEERPHPASSDADFGGLRLDRPAGEGLRLSGHTVEELRAEHGPAPAPAAESSPASASSYNVPPELHALQSGLALFQAIRAGAPIAAVSAGVNLVSQLARAAGEGAGVFGEGAGAVLGLVGAIDGLFNADEGLDYARSGTTLVSQADALWAAANARRFAPCSAGRGSRLAQDPHRHAVLLAGELPDHRPRPRPDGARTRGHGPYRDAELSRRPAVAGIRAVPPGHRNPSGNRDPAGAARPAIQRARLATRPQLPL
jgi:hypothetical protein